MDIVKIAVAAVISTVLYVIVRQNRPEYAVFVAVGGLTAVIVPCVNLFSQVFGWADTVLDFAGISRDSTAVLFKSLGVCIVTQTASDICNDNGSKTLAGAVELVGKAAVLVIAMPLMISVAELATGLING